MKRERDWRKPRNESTYNLNNTKRYNILERDQMKSDSSKTPRASSAASTSEDDMREKINRAKAAKFDENSSKYCDVN